MASNKTIVVLTPNGRRQNVKVTPNTSLLQVLEDVCKKHGFNPNEYDVKHHNTILDTSQLMQFSGLPNNALLEMAPASRVRSESAVTLGVQLENGERLMGSFLPSSNLWDIIMNICPSEVNADDLVVIYMRCETFGKDSLQSTSLKQLGITGGRAMIRIIHRKPEYLKIQANVSAPLPSKPVEEKPYKRTLIKIDSPTSTSPAPLTPSTSTAPQQEQRTIEKKPKTDSQSDHTESHSPPTDSYRKIVPKNQTRFAEQSTSANVQKQTVHLTSSDKQVVFKKKRACPECGYRPIKFNDKMAIKLFKKFPWVRFKQPRDVDLSQIHQLGERNALVFSLEMAKSLPQEDLPDEFFDLTVNDARLLLSELKERRKQIEDTPLQTEALRSFEKDKRILRNLNKYQSSVLRILFPNRTVLQGTFNSTETLQIVMDFVRNYLHDPSLDFYLYTTPPKEILNPSVRLIEADLVPCAVVHFGVKNQSSDEDSYLKKELTAKYSSYNGASLIANQSRGAALTSQKSNDEEVDSEENITFPTLTGGSISRSKPKPSDKNVPKWFKPL